MKLERSRSGVPTISTASSLGRSSSNRTRISSRARCAPRQRCGLCSPKATWSFGLRDASKWYGLDELRGVEVRGDVPHHDLVARSDRRPAQLGVLGRGPTEVHRRRAPAQHLVDGDLDGRRVVAQLGEQRGPLGDRLDPRRHGVARRVVASRHHQREEVLQLVVVEKVPVDRRLQQRRQHVVRRVRTALGERTLGELEQLDGHGAAEGEEPVLGRVDLVDDEVGEVGVGVADERVAAVHEPVEVLVRQSQAGDPASSSGAGGRRGRRSRSSPRCGPRRAPLVRGPGRHLRTRRPREGRTDARRAAGSGSAAAGPSP